MALVVSPITGVTYLPQALGVQAILGAQRTALVPQTPAPQPTAEPARQLPTGSPRLTDSVLRSLLFDRTAADAAANAVAADAARQEAITRSNALQSAQNDAAVADALQADAAATPLAPATPQPVFETELPTPAPSLANVPLPDFPDAQPQAPAAAALAQPDQTASNPATAAREPIPQAPFNPVTASRVSVETPVPVATDLQAQRLQTRLDSLDAARLAAPREAAPTPQPQLTALTEPAAPPTTPTLPPPLEAPQTPIADLAPPPATPAADLTDQDLAFTSTLAAAQPFTNPPPTALPTPPLPNAAFTASLINSNELAVPPPVSPATLPDTTLSPAALASAAQLASQPALGDLAADRAALTDIPLDAPLLDPIVNPALETAPDLAANLPITDAPLPLPVITSPEANQVIADLADAGLAEAQEIDPRSAAAVIASEQDALTTPPVTGAPEQAAPIAEPTTPQPAAVPTLAEQLAEPVTEPAPEPAEAAVAPEAPALVPTPLSQPETIEVDETPVETVTRPASQPALQFSPMLAQYQAIDTMQKYYVAPNGQRLPDVDIPQSLRAPTPPPIEPIRQVSPISPILRELRV